MAVGLGRKQVHLLFSTLDVALLVASGSPRPEFKALEIKVVGSCSIRSPRYV